MVDQARLSHLVGQAMPDQTASVTNWSYQPLEGDFSGAAVYRFRGQAQTTEGNKPWSLILKALRPKSENQAPADDAYWKREVLLYQSGLLSDLPRDLLAPRCFEIVEHSDDEIWLWIEDMRAEEGRAEDTEWPLDI